MIHPSITAAALALAILAVPSKAEIVPSQCRLIRYGGINPPPENFACDFRQSGGNVTVNSKNWAFTFLEKNRTRLLSVSTASHSLSLVQAGIPSR